MQTDLSRRSYGRLPILILLMALVILIIGAVALHYVENRLVDTTGESLALAAADIADMLDRLLFERYSDIPMMARAQVFQGRNRAAMTDYLNWVLRNYQVYRWLGVLDASGRIIAATSPASVGKDLSRTHLFQTVHDYGGIQVRDVEISEEAGGIPVVSFAGPIVGPRGEFLGAIMTHVGLSILEDVSTGTVHTFQVLRGSAGKIEYQFMTRDGDLIVDSLLRQEMQVNLKLMALPSALLSASALPGYIEEVHLRRKIPVVTGYSQTDGSGLGDFVGLHWGVLVRMERSDILAPIRTVLVNLAIAGILIVLPLLGFLLWTSGRLQEEWARAREESTRASAAEASLRLRDRAIAETSNGILITDPHQPDNPIIYANPAFEHITGYRMDEVLGRNCRFLQGSDTDRAAVAVIRQAIAEQRDCQVVIRNYRKDGAPFWNELTISPVHDERGRVSHFIGVLVNITASKQADERRIEVEKLAALGQVAAGVAHEINNPLAGIKNAFLLLKDTIVPGHPNSQYVSMIDREIQRISDIVGQMYQLYRPDPAELRHIDLEAVLRDVSQIMAGLLRQRRLSLTTEISPDLPQVRLPQRDLTQILCNLIRNAIEASPPSSEIRISVTHDEEIVSIAVADHGEGILAEVLSHIFEPFFTTKMGSTQGGMGLGLSVSRSLVEAMGGRIEVQTAVGRGATFTVVLPCNAAVASSSVRSEREQPHHV
ncbi:MAG TPA: ATP-binding protein [Nitrospirales bacterium]|nr:ATP-binding protein [Nitrospirales bacterium]